MVKKAEEKQQTAQYGAVGIIFQSPAVTKAKKKIKNKKPALYFFQQSIFYLCDIHKNNVSVCANAIQPTEAEERVHVLFLDLFHFLMSLIFLSSPGTSSLAT